MLVEWTDTPCLSDEVDELEQAPSKAHQAEVVRRHLDGPSDGVSLERQKLERSTNISILILVVKTPDLR